MSSKLKITIIILAALLVSTSAFLATYFLFNKPKDGETVGQKPSVSDKTESSASAKFSSLGLIKKDFDEGKISAAKYFSQKVAYVLGSPALDQKYIINADQSANEAILCGYPVFKEMDDYQQDPKSNPQAVETIKVFLNPKSSFDYFEAKKTAQAPPETKFIKEVKAQTVDANTSGPSNCRYGSNYCRLPSEQLRNRINGLFNFAKSATAAPNDPFWNPNLNNMYLIKEMVNLDKCLCADAGSGNIIEIYYHSADDFVASRVQSYLETSKPWAQFQKQIYVKQTPDPKPLYDVTSPDFLSKKDKPLAVYLLRTLADPGLMIPATVTSGGVTQIRSAVLMNPLKLEEQEFQVKDRQNNKTVINKDSKILGTFIHEVIHSFDYTQSKYNHFAKNPYFEGFTMAMEQLIRPNLNHTLMYDQFFYNYLLNKNLYRLDFSTEERDVYGSSMIFRYIASLTGGNTPLADYLKKLATRNGKDLLFSDYLSKYGARFAVSNLNIDYPNIGENIFQYKKTDASYPAGFSAPRYDGKVVATGPTLETSDKKEIENLIVDPGQVHYQVVNYLGNRVDHRYIEINHAPFTGGQNRQLGVLLLDVDKEIGNNETDYDKYILGDNASNIAAAKYYEFNGASPKAKICLDDGSVRPNVMVLVFANNDTTRQVNISSGSGFEIITRASCDKEAGSYIKINGIVSRRGSQSGAYCGQVTSDEKYKLDFSLTNITIEEGAKPVDNEAVGSQSGILASFSVKADKPKLLNEVSAQVQDPCYDQDERCTGDYDVYNFASHFSSDLGHTGRLILYNDGQYTFTMDMNTKGIEGHLRNKIDASSVVCETSTYYPAETEVVGNALSYILRLHGRFADGASQINGSSTIPLVAEKGNIMPLVTMGNQAHLPIGLSDYNNPNIARRGFKIGDAEIRWNFEIPPMKYCTADNHCVDPNEPKPKPPVYWNLPPFCETWSPNYTLDDDIRCGAWLDMTVGNQSRSASGGSIPNSLDDYLQQFNDQMRQLNNLVPK